MAKTVVHASNSTIHSKGGKCPMIGSTASAANSWRKALTSVANSTMKATAVIQCATATAGSRAMRV